MDFDSTGTMSITSTGGGKAEGVPFFHAPLPAQLVIGAACGALNILVNQAVNLLHIPFFLDEFLVVAAAFFGWAGGLACVAVHKSLSIVLIALTRPHTLSFVPLDSCFAICDIAAVALVRVMFGRDRRIQSMKLLLCGVMLAILISILGGGVFTILFTCFGYGEIASVRYLTMLLTSSRIPLALSSMLSRMPVNLVDKPVCVLLGYLIARLIKRLLGITKAGAPRGV